MPEVSSLSDAALMDAIGRGGGVPANPLASMSDADLMKAIGQQQDAPVTAGGLAKAAGTGVVKGVTGLLGAPADLTSLGASGIDTLTGSNLAEKVAPFQNEFGSQRLQTELEKKTGPLHQPQNTAEQYAQTAGEFAPGMIGGPEGLATRALTRVALPAAASETAGQITQGTDFEAPARIAGAVLGSALPQGISRAISPATVAPEHAAAVSELKNAGVAMSAATQIGSKAAGFIESELGNAVGAGSQATKANRSTMETFTKAALKNGGAVDETGNIADNYLPANIKANAKDIGDGFNAVAAKYDQQNPIALDPTFKASADQIVDTFRANQGRDPGPILDFMKRMGIGAQPQIPSGLSAQAKASIAAQLQQTAKPMAITGQTYQSINSDLARVRRGATNSDLKYALDSFKTALNDAVQKGLAPQDQGTWQQLRTRWLNHLILRDAVKTTTEPAAEGFITPTKLTASINKFTKTGYTNGTSSLEPLARAGNQVLKSLPDSGTAARASARTITALGAAGLGFHLGALPGAIAGIAGPAAAGRAIFSRPVQSYLVNQRAAGFRPRPTAIRSGILALPGAEGR